jgi:ADP-ribose pyrophosphatase YjhB (NUDIX family)
MENNIEKIVNHVHDLKRGVDFIGVCVVFMCHDGNGRILLHKRSNKCRDEHGTWDCGGGAVEFGEDLEGAVKREIKEEYGVDVEDLQFVNHESVVRKNGETHTHWIAMRFSAKVDPNKVINGDPEKIDEIGWFELDNLPTPLHSVLGQRIALVKNILLKR